MSTFFCVADTDNFPLADHVRIHIVRVDRDPGCTVDAINRVSSRMNTVELVRTWLRQVRSCDAQTDSILPLVPPLRECGASNPDVTVGRSKRWVGVAHTGHWFGGSTSSSSRVCVNVFHGSVSSLRSPLCCGCDFGGRTHFMWEFILRDFRFVGLFWSTQLRTSYLTRGPPEVSNPAKRLPCMLIISCSLIVCLGG